MKLRHVVTVLVLVAITGALWFSFSQELSWTKIFVGSEPARSGAYKNVPEEIRKFVQLASPNREESRTALTDIEENWQPGYRYQLLQVFRSVPKRRGKEITEFLAKKTGQDFKNEISKWQIWSWKEDYVPSDDFPVFLQYSFGRIDPRFSVHFRDTDNAKIRLDEIRWGGVRRDGIPPLKDPRMIPVADADYLNDSDVVFGVELNGESKCYPKRILAWHEMFKDTIGGESIAGVY